MRTSEDESILEYFLRVVEVTIMIREHGEEVKEEMIFQKVLRCFPMRFNAKVSDMEEMANLKNLKMEWLLGTLKTYEMRVGREKFEPNEEAFKVSKKAKEQKDHQDCSNYESDQELAQLARKLMHWLGKYKGNFSH